VLQPILVSRYLIVITPALALAGAAAIASAARRRVGITAAALAVLIGVFAFRIVEWCRSVPEDWRGAAAFITREQRPGDPIVVAPSWSLLAYRYYDPTSPVEATAYATGRTLLVLYTPPDVRPSLAVTRSEAARAVIGGRRLVLGGQRDFGRHLVVQVYHPRR
jgi:hypothetical protein